MTAQFALGAVSRSKCLTLLAPNLSAGIANKIKRLMEFAEADQRLFPAWGIHWGTRLAIRGPRSALPGRPLASHRSWAFPLYLVVPRKFAIGRKPSWQLRSIGQVVEALLALDPWAMTAWEVFCMGAAGSRECVRYLFSHSMIPVNLNGVFSTAAAALIDLA